MIRALGTQQGIPDGPLAPLWIRRPEMLHVLAYATAALVFTGQLVVVLARGSGWLTVLSVLLAGGGVALSWWLPWPGLVVTTMTARTQFTTYRKLILKRDTMGICG